MLDYRIIEDTENHDTYLETSLKGTPLLNIPQLNKGTAFSKRERHELELLGKLPLQVETLEAQVNRAYLQYQRYQNDMQKNIYLNNLHDKNQVVFYKLVSEHLLEMMPLVYTPVVGNAVKKYSHEFRQPRGLYISYPERDHIKEMLKNRSNPHIDLIVVSDGEGVLGIGDQGVGAIDIPIAKLMVYTLFAGISPNHALPIVLDVGTNNQELLKDPFYLGWRHSRIQSKEYYEFIEQFISALEESFPYIFLHYEDFGRDNAYQTLQKFRHRLCSFNDDIQGTGIAALAALMTACHLTQRPLIQQRIVIFGAGTAGLGIAEQICQGMVKQGLTLEQARQQFWLIDRYGLITLDTPHITESQRKFARTDISNLNLTFESHKDLFTVIQQIHPTTLIGCSAQAGAFTQPIIQEMQKYCEHPIIFPLSNPNSLCEAQPSDLIQWTDGKAKIATGSPFTDVIYNNKTYKIAQCNNALVFPGIGLGVIAVQAKELNEAMIWAACKAMTRMAIENVQMTGALLPSLTEAPRVSQHIACEVAFCAIEESLVAEKFKYLKPSDISSLIQTMRWFPQYIPYYYQDRRRGFYK